MTLAGYLALYAVLLIAYLATLVHLALKAAKDGDESPLPSVLGRPLSQPLQHEGKM
jgi:cytochrome bd ubiquinol oxidase subunit I